MFKFKAVIYNLLVIDLKAKTYCKKNFYRRNIIVDNTTVTSRLFTHIVSTEKMRKYMRDLKDMSGTKYTYCNSYFLILVLIKSTLGLSHI